jgi:hypothetical protein
MKYYLAYSLMLLSFGYLSFVGQDIKSKIIGLLCLLLNAVIFWR